MFMKNIYYGIKSKGVSSKNICDWTNEYHLNRSETHCYFYDGGGIFFETKENEHALKHKLEREFNIELSDPHPVKDYL